VLLNDCWVRHKYGESLNSLFMFFKTLVGSHTLLVANILSDNIGAFLSIGSLVTAPNGIRPMRRITALRMMCDFFSIFIDFLDSRKK
jgi:hypothetical protein